MVGLLLLWLSSILLPDLHGKLQNPFAGNVPVRVFLFARSDCPVTNRYASEWSRIAHQFESQQVRFTVVYPDRQASPDELGRHMREYALAGNVLRDPQHALVKRTGVITAPEVVVFDSSERETYHGRIDDLYLSPGRSRPEGAQVHDLEDAIRATLAGKPVAHAVTRAVGCSLADVQ